MVLSVHVAQGQAAKFGKVSEEELKMRVYEKDTSAAAVILSDYGYSHFQYSNSGFQLVFERQMRIKILKKSGYDWADVVVPFYKRGSDKEAVSSIKGFTYNLVNGKEEKTKLESKAAFEEQMSENWFAKKFTMPNVREGSVIDVSYVIYSDFFQNMREWEFQHTIPVVWSEYKARIPEYFDYKLLQQGYLPFYNSGKEKTTENFTVKSAAEIEPGLNGGRTPSATSTVKADGDAYVWVMKDVPALQPEKYITTLSDYQAKIEFELQQVKFPGQIAKVVVGTWEQVTDELLRSDRFGTQLNRSSFFKNELAALMIKHTTPESRMVAIHNLVKSKMQWDGKNSIYAHTPIRKVYENKKGSVGEINLLMTSMLLEAGLDAAPVLVSTRTNGRVYKGSPMLSKFNYLITHVRIGDKEYLLDATEPLLAAGELPVRSLNGEGRLIKKDDQRWVELKPGTVYSKLFNGTITISSNGEMKGTGMESMGGYNAFYTRKSILEEGEAKFVEGFAKETGDMKVLKPKIENLSDEKKPISISFEIATAGNGQENSVIYLNPMLGHNEKENPFKLEERAYPVDFATLQDETYMCKFILPPGYEIEEMPQNKMVSLPENGGRFMYVVQQEGNTVQVMSKVNINKTVFYAPEYGHLKEFYNQIVTKQAEQIVLKKATARN